MATKLGFTVDEFKEIMNGKNKTYRDYKNSMGFIEMGMKVMRFIGGERKLIR